LHVNEEIKNLASHKDQQGAEPLKGSGTDADSIKAGKDYSTALPSFSTIKSYFLQLYIGLFFQRLIES